MATPQSQSRVLSLLSREDIAARILAGDNIVIYHSHVLSIPHHWLSAHPGGALSILHFVGRDASDEIDAFHNETLRKQVRGYTIGRVEVDEKIGWAPFIPPFEMGWVRKLDERTGRLKWIREAQALFADAELPQSQIFLVSSEDLAATDAGAKINTDTHAPTMETIRMPPTSLSAAVQARHSIAYRELHDLVVSKGLYDTPYLTGYGPEFVRYTLLAIVSYVSYQYKYFTISAVFLGFLWHQLTFLVHDLGHMGVTHNWVLDRLFSIFLADFIGGLSVGWWVHNHNIHHLVTNHPSHDPDIEHLPFFAISPVFLNSLYSSYYDRLMQFDLPARVFLSVQHKLFYVVMSLARFNLYANSYVFLAKEKLERRFVVNPSDTTVEDEEQPTDQPNNTRRKQVKKARGGEFGGWSWWLEVVGIVFYWTWYIYVLRGIGGFWPAIRYMLISHIVTSPLHVQIVLSHFSRSTDDLGPTESFFHRQLRTTIDVICPPSLAFVHGGLHLQVTHHLFPRLPRHNLLRASILVKEYAKREGLEYAEFEGFWKGESEVRGVLGNVAEVVRQVGIVRGVAGDEVRKVVERVEAERREREKLRIQKEAELEKLSSKQ